jgi:hypothetical protein
MPFNSRAKATSSFGVGSEATGGMPSLNGPITTNLSEGFLFLGPLRKSPAEATDGREVPKTGERPEACYALPQPADWPR